MYLGVSTDSGANFGTDDVIIQVYNEFGALLGNGSQLMPPVQGSE